MKKAKEKLPPIPSPRRKGPPQGLESPAVDGKPAPPDLSHIIESLRSLAVPIGDVELWTGNPVKHPEKQLEEIQASFRQFGQVEPLVVNRQTSPWTLVGGNGRLQAALLMNWQHVAVAFVDLSPAKAKTLGVVLNRSSEGREWDKDYFAKLIEDIDTGGEELFDGMISELSQELGITPADDDEQNKNSGRELTVIVKCGSIEEQDKAFAELSEQGYSVRMTGRGRRRKAG